MRLDTTEVRSHRFYVNIKPYWPSLLASSSNIKNKSVLMFPLTQVGNTSYRAIKLHNPSTSPLIVQLVMDWSYPQGARLYHSLPMKYVTDYCLVDKFCKSFLFKSKINDEKFDISCRFKPVCAECSSTIPEEFKLEENADERELFEKQWGVTIAPQSLPLYLNPSETRTIRVAYIPFSTSASSGFLYIRQVNCEKKEREREKILQVPYVLTHILLAFQK